MKEYHKIQSVFMRDPDNKFKTFLLGQYTLPEFEYLANNEWVFTEKIDGTNIRVMLTDIGVEFGGKTDKAQIPAKLVKHLRDTFTEEKMRAQFPDGGCCLYGEGCGAGIQKGGGNYYQDQRFVLFDVRVGPWWLKRDAIEDIAKDLDIPAAPIVGTGTLHDAVKLCQEGFNSAWGDFPAEGIVVRPKVDLFARSGGRVITKIKLKDFR